MDKYKALSVALCIVILSFFVISYSLKEYKKVNPFHASGATYVSGTGTAGAPNTAQTVMTRTIPSNTLTQNGDRLRIRVYAFSAINAGIVATVKLNGVPVADFNVVTATVPDIVECYLHYIDNTHANIIEQEIGAIGSLSAVNVAGFNFASSQDITVEQTAVVLNFITIYGVFVDVLPKGAI